jgi:serine/threonine protein phosphatase 1
MRTLVIGDIHGGLLALEQVILKAKVSSTDTLIFLGDYVDGWSQSPQVIDFLMALQKKQNCIFIKGNHDELLLDYFTNEGENIDMKMWYIHGGEATIEAYKKYDTDGIEKHIEFLKNLLNYHIDAKNRLFIHAGFTNAKGVSYEYFPRMYYWDRTLWETALSLDANLKPNHYLYPKRFLNYSEIFIGHTPLTQINETKPMNRGNVWNLDTGAAFYGPLTIMDIDTKEFWQSDPNQKLYPLERGRN